VRLSHLRLVALSLGLAVTSAAGAAGQDIASTWVAYYRAGLVVPHPVGWQVQERGSGAFTVSRPGAALIYVKPLSFPAGRSAADVLRLLPWEEAALFSGAQVGRPSFLPEGAMCALSFVLNGQPFGGSALVLKGQSSGALYVMSATRQAWPAAADEMAQILAGFRYLSPDAGPEGLPEMVLWRDPTEGAFTLPVPRGWHVNGRLARPNSIEHRPEVLAAAPDDTVQLRVGDGSLEVFAVPYDLPMIGAPPPGTRPSAFGGTFHPYLPGQQFITRFYLPRKLPSARLLHTVNLPQLAELAFRLDPPPPPMQGRADAGAAHFEVALPAGVHRGYYAAVTHLIAPPTGLGGTSSWYLGPLDVVGYLCRPEREPLARTILGEMVRRFAWDLHWYAAQLKVDAAVARQVIAGNAELNEIRWQTIRQQAAGMERAQEPLGTAARGEIWVRDDMTGERRRVPQTGSQDYFLVHRTGEVVVSDRSDLPPFDFRRMTQVN
jgi:hypothetical protein